MGIIQNPEAESEDNPISMHDLLTLLPLDLYSSL